jgi:hypothetical protein
MTADAPLQSDAPHAVVSTEQTTLCLQCGYPLIGLGADGACPECGLAVAESIERSELARSGVGHLYRLRIGAAILGWTGLFAIVILMIGALGRRYELREVIPPVWRLATLLKVRFVFVLGSYIAPLLLIAGWFLLSRRRPGSTESPIERRTRWVSRISLIVAGFGMFGYATLHLLIQSGRMSIPMQIEYGARAIETTCVLIALGAFVAHILTALRCTSSIAEQLRRERLARRLHFIRWMCAASAMALLVFISARSVLPSEWPTIAAMLAFLLGSGSYAVGMLVVGGELARLSGRIAKARRLVGR